MRGCAAPKWCHELCRWGAILNILRRDTTERSEDRWIGCTTLLRTNYSGVTGCSLVRGWPGPMAGVSTERQRPRLKRRSTGQKAQRPALNHSRAGRSEARIRRRYRLLTPAVEGCRMTHQVRAGEAGGPAEEWGEAARSGVGLSRGASNPRRFPRLPGRCRSAQGQTRVEGCGAGSAWLWRPR